MSDGVYTPEEISACKAAMSKPAPIEALMLLASGRVVAHVSDDGRQVFLETLDGQQIRDRGHKMSIAGAWPLYIAGMIDKNCALTEAGRKLLASPPEPQLPDVRAVSERRPPLEEFKPRTMGLLKSLAKKIKKRDGITHTAALEVAARQAGFPTYQAALNALGKPAEGQK